MLFFMYEIKKCYGKFCMDSMNYLDLLILMMILGLLLSYFILNKVINYICKDVIVKGV